MTAQRHPLTLTFDYDYQRECWNFTRDSVPPQLKYEGVPPALWMHFWDCAQTVAERATVRNTVRRKLKAECRKDTISKQEKTEHETEIRELDSQTLEDFNTLQQQTERLFGSVKARVSTDVRTGEPFGLEIEVINSTYMSDTVHLQYDDRRGSWNIPRHHFPQQLATLGVSRVDWATVWEYADGVNDRAKEREALNEAHEKELRLCRKSLSYMNSTHVDTVDQNARASHNTTANHIRTKMEKLQKAKAANLNNTKKGWQELQRRANQRFEQYGITAKVFCEENQVCYYKLELKCPRVDQRQANTRSSSLGACSIGSLWLPSVTSPPCSPRTSADRSILWPSVISRRDPPPFSHGSKRQTPSDVLVPSKKLNTEKENGSYKPKKHSSDGISTTGRTWRDPVLLTYIHDETAHKSVEIMSIPSTTSESDMDHLTIPPAPSDPPSSIGSASSGPSFISSFKTAFSKKKNQRVRFGEKKVHVYDNPYVDMDKDTLWVTHEDREANRNHTKMLAQRVIDNRKHGSADNVIFIDNETKEEVCWRGLEPAQKGNLQSRQDIRRTFLMKVLDKQRLVQMACMISRRGMVADPAAELQHYAARQSRHCRERAQKLGAQDAKAARSVYKESLRNTNPGTSSGSSSSTGTGSATNNAFSYITGRNISHNTHTNHSQNDIFQDYCRQMHLVSKTRFSHQQPIAAS